MSDSSNSQKTASLETPASLEPMLLDEITPELADEAAAIVGEVSRLGANLPDQTLSSLAYLVRLMNCYYSNLIEGHKTPPQNAFAGLIPDSDNPDQKPA